MTTYRHRDQATPWRVSPNASAPRSAPKVLWDADREEAGFEGRLAIVSSGTSRPIVYGDCVLTPPVINFTKLWQPYTLHATGAEPQNRTIGSSERVLIHAVVGDGVHDVIEVQVAGEPVPRESPFTGSDPTIAALHARDCWDWSAFGRYRPTRSASVEAPLDELDYRQSVPARWWEDLQLPVGHIALTVSAVDELGVDGLGLPTVDDTARFAPGWDWGYGPINSPTTLQARPTADLSKSINRLKLKGAPGEPVFTGRAGHTVSATFIASVPGQPVLPSPLWARRKGRDGQDGSKLALQGATYESGVTVRQTSLLAVLLTASRHSDPSQLRCRVRGAAVRVPSNAFTDTAGRLSFSGTWDGQLTDSSQWCADPAWVLLDLLTNAVYGSGVELTRVDLDSFYQASVRNNEPAWTGSTFARHVWHGPITVSESAADVFPLLCQVMQAELVWDRGRFSLVQDRPVIASDVLPVVANQDVADGLMSYTAIGAAQPATAVRTIYRGNGFGSIGGHAWTYQDAQLAETYPFREQEIDLPSQAPDVSYPAAHGRAWLETQAIEREEVSFQQPLCELMPGQVIQLVDQSASWQRNVSGAAVKDVQAGAVKAVSGSTVDTGYSEFTVAGTITVFWEAPAGSWNFGAATISAGVITFASVPSPTPIVGLGWAVQNLWRVRSVVESGTGGEVKATRYDHTKYGRIEASAKAAQGPVDPTVPITPPNFYVPKHNVSSGQIELSFARTLDLAAQVEDDRFELELAFLTNTEGSFFNEVQQVTGTSFKRPALPGRWRFRCWHTWRGSRVGPPRERVLSISSVRSNVAQPPDVWRPLSRDGDKLTMSYEGGSNFTELRTRFACDMPCGWNTASNEEVHPASPPPRGESRTVEVAWRGSGCYFAKPANDGPDLSSLSRVAHVGDEFC